MHRSERLQSRRQDQIVNYKPLTFFIVKSFMIKSTQCLCKQTKECKILKLPYCSLVIMCGTCLENDELHNLRV